ncbi:MAG: AAA family ATPase [Gemmatimonadota bacterium]|nr:AAA family ATPase [Gemmatimonadota bacterium]
MVEIQSLGGVELRHPGGEPITLRSKKHVALLLYLAFAEGRAFTRGRLVQLFWTTTAERARHSLSQAFYDLGRKLDGAIRTDRRKSVVADPKQVTLDALQFQQAFHEGRLAEAIGLYKGPFADGLVGVATPEFDQWLESQRTQLRRVFEVALRNYVAECETTGNWAHMCTAALRLVDASPLDEGAHLALMRALWLQGDRQGAITHFESVEKTLLEEVSGGMSDAMRDFVDRLRRNPEARTTEVASDEPEGPLVGRSAEFELLQQAATSLRESTVSAILVTGEAGIGKSRLLREFKRSLTVEDVRLIESRCFPAEQELPYGPIVEAIGPIASELLVTPEAAKPFARLGYMLPDFPVASIPEDEGVDPSAWRRRLYEEVSHLMGLAAERKPIVWIIDDAHWIDDTSAGLLHYVGRRLAKAPFLLVASVRASRYGPLPERIPVASPHDSNSTVEIRLQPLSRGHVRELLVGTRPEMEHHPVVGIAQRLASGNPFYALALLMTAVTAGEWTPDMEDWEPLNDESVRDLLAVRFRNVRQSGSRLLQSVAVLERHATPRLVSKVAGLELDEAADESADLYSKGLLIDGDSHLDFVNDLMREYVYTEMTGMRRTALHLRAARLLEEEPDTEPGLLARHYFRGDEKRKAYGYALAAATQAAASGGHTEAVSMAELARSAAATPDEDLAALRILAESELKSARLESAREHFNELLRLEPDLPAEDVIRLKLRMVECSTEGSRWEISKQTLQEIHADARSATSESTQVLATAEALFWQLKVAIRQRDSVAAREISENLSKLSGDGELWKDESLTREARVSVLTCNAAYSLFFVDVRQAETYLRHAEGFASDLQETWASRLEHLNGLVATRLAKWDQATHIFRTIERRARKNHELLTLTSAWNNLACCAMESGQWDKCEEYLSSVETVQKSLSDPIDVALLTKLNRATAQFYQGRSRDAEETFLATEQMARQAAAEEFLPQIDAWLALILLQRGDRSEAQERIDRLSATSAAEQPGAQEIYHLEWLHAYLDRDTRAGRKRLTEALERLGRLDRSSGLKLRCVEALFLDRRRQPPDDLKEQMRDHSLAWFPYRLRRWYDSTRGA